MTEAAIRCCRRQQRRRCSPATGEKETRTESMGKLMQELRFALRRIGRNRFAALVVVVSLALGIGLNVVVFSLINMILLRPLPISRPESLVRLYTGTPAES